MGKIEAPILSLQSARARIMNDRVQFINQIVIPSTNIYWVPILIKTLLCVLGIYQRTNKKSVGS